MLLLSQGVGLPHHALGSGRVATGPEGLNWRWQNGRKRAHETDEQMNGGWTEVQWSVSDTKWVGFWRWAAERLSTRSVNYNYNSLAKFAY